MQNQEDGYSLVETLIALVLGTVLLFAFYDLYTSTIRVSQATVERNYAFNLASRYLDQGRFLAATRNQPTYDSTGQNTPFKNQPQARGDYVVRTETSNATATLYLRTVTVTYGPPTSRQTVQLKAYIRYAGGLYY